MAQRPRASRRRQEDGIASSENTDTHRIDDRDQVDIYHTNPATRPRDQAPRPGPATRLEEGRLFGRR
jgi:hypothetical protein